MGSNVLLLPLPPLFDPKLYSSPKYPHRLIVVILIFNLVLTSARLGLAFFGAGLVTTDDTRRGGRWCLMHHATRYHAHCPQVVLVTDSNCGSQQ
jgi:hypothetical protein